MTEKELIEKQYSPDKRLQRYQRALDRGRMSSTQKARAVGSYREILRLEDDLAGASRAVLDEHGVVQASHRRLMSSMVRRLAGIVRHEPHEHWPQLAAEAGAGPVRRGMDRELVWECLLACWERMKPAGMDGNEALAERFRIAADEAARHKPKPVPMLAVAGIIGSGPERQVSPELAAELRARTELDAFQDRKAAEDLKQALVLLKPWVRRVVVGRLAERKSDAELGQAYDLTPDEVSRVIAQARHFVGRYTTYYDEEWWWREPLARKVEPESMTKKEGPAVARRRRSKDKVTGEAASGGSET